MNEQIFIDGKRADDALPNRSLFYGEGVFETFRYKSGLPVLLENHLERMRLGADFLSIHFPGQECLMDLIQKAVIDSKIKDAYVKICLLSQGDTGFYTASNRSQVLVIIKKYAKSLQSLKLKINPYKRSSGSPLLGVKSTNYLENILARRGAMYVGFNEALFINEKDQVAECASSNLFWFKNGTFYTPAVNCGILPGTTRNLMIKLIADSTKYQIVEDVFLLEDLNKADFVFVTNALSGCIPISQIDDYYYDINNSLFVDIQNRLFKELNWL